MDPEGWSLAITGTAELSRANIAVTKSASLKWRLVSMRNSRPMAMSTGGVSAGSPHAARMRSYEDAGVAALAVHAHLRPPGGGTG